MATFEVKSVRIGLDRLSNSELAKTLLLTEIANKLSVVSGYLDLEYKDLKRRIDMIHPKLPKDVEKLGEELAEEIAKVTADFLSKYNTDVALLSVALVAMGYAVTNLESIGRALAELVTNYLKSKGAKEVKEQEDNAYA